MPALVAMVGVFCGCTDLSVRELERVRLFRLGIGKAEHQMDIFFRGAESRYTKNRVAMHDGMVFVANGEGAKLMEFSSYGDLVTVLYNDALNPRPTQVDVAVANTVGGDTIVTRRAGVYPFENVGEIAVSSRKTIVVEDHLPDERSVFDVDLGQRLNRVILRFDANARYVDYLGQEGVGGTPFAFIEDVYINQRDEIIVVSRSERTWFVHWFTPDGELLVPVEIPTLQLPVPASGDVIPHLDAVVPDTWEYDVYVKIDYYREPIDPETGGRRGVETLDSRVYTLSLGTGRYERYFELPSLMVPAGPLPGSTGEALPVLYSFVGAARGGNLFFTARETPESLQLAVFAADGSLRRRARLALAGARQTDLHLSIDGVITALVADETGADVVWWRSDRIIESFQP